ncbi:MAG: tetratricopeptide repeat protein [Pyrinomonadaceae bacterium]
MALQTNAPIDATGAAKAIEEYVAAETDPVKKAKAQASLGDALFQSGKIDEAVAAYQQILTGAPENLDAMYGLGLALAADPSADVAKMTQARDMLQEILRQSSGHASEEGGSRRSNRRSQRSAQGCLLKTRYDS